MSDTLQHSDAPSWSQWITNFDATYAAFYDKFNRLMQIGPTLEQVDPGSIDVYNQVLQKASDAAYQLEQWKVTRNYVASWLGSVGQAMVDAPGGFAMNGLGQILQTVFRVAGGIVAAVTFIQWIAAVMDSIDYIINHTTAVVTAMNEGKTISDANAIADVQFGKPVSFGSSIGSSLGAYLAIGLLIWFGPSLLNYLTAQSRK